MAYNSVRWSSKLEIPCWSIPVNPKLASLKHRIYDGISQWNCALLWRLTSL